MRRMLRTCAAHVRIFEKVGFKKLFDNSLSLCFQCDEVWSMYKAKCRDRYWQQRDHILQRSKVHKATGRGKAMQAKNNFKRHSANARRVLEETAADTRTDVERINSLIEALPGVTSIRCPWR